MTIHSDLHRYKKKDGMPHMDKCPEQFLNVMSHRLQTRAYDIEETVVAHGDVIQPVCLANCPSLSF